MVRTHPAADATCLQCGDVPPVRGANDLRDYLEDRAAEELMQGGGRVYRGAMHGRLRL